ncbi:zinc finger CCHC domain-containing protein 8 isoform X2 [Pieris rapae]|uniref:zinc finger CCHC domain-containing protein 8 isoform X2 n=1 Tax=Pieris rapae TaxID=64459 RepID=UPI001E27A78F|nr:zinc finger CCHC domain-containing protein 8 isoform X2 [Pieris rapae]
MAKRKAGMKDIIYELDNEDLSGSSDDEHKNSKTKISKPNTGQQVVQEITSSKKFTEDADKVHEHFIKITPQNGGKSDRNVLKSNSNYRNMSTRNGSGQTKDKKEHPNTIIFNEDIQIDSSASNSDLSIVESEHKTPLISIQFRDKRFAKLYKSKIKNFMLDLIKEHDNEGLIIDSDTEPELDIWPTESTENKTEVPSYNDNLFFVDTAPCRGNTDVPMYKQASQLISNIQEDDLKVNETQATRPRFTCFNCDGEHQLKDCRKPRNHSRIAEKRRNLGVKLGRYHVEDEQKYGHLIPGRISGQLRHALGIKRYELPLYIYRMRLLGYPCGWMEEAKILPSGINMFDSTGTRILDPGEEDGEVFEPGTKDRYDIKKIYDFPGFNVPTSSTYIEESHLYGLPPLSEQDSKFIMLQRLAPNAMKAYKRKKLTFFPSSANNSQEGQAEMELDSGDEMAEFPSVPPLPDDEPPYRPSPPPPPPELPSSPKPSVTQTPTKSSEPVKSKTPEKKSLNSEKLKNPATIGSEFPNSKQSVGETSKSTTENNSDNKSTDDIEIVEVMLVPDIPMPEDDLITIDDDDETLPLSGRNSPSIDDLEAEKQQLLDAIKSAEIANDSGTDTEMSKEVIVENISLSTADESVEIVEECILLESDNEDKASKQDISNIIEKPQTAHAEETTIEPADEVPTPSESSMPEVKTGKVKETLYGTPVLNIASPFMKLPSDDKFAKDICDIINFENLPNSVGKYKKICSLLKKVKSEVDRIQES